MGRPTIRDVAERAGVSKSLVSLVMRGGDHVSDAKRRRVLQAADELGYLPNAVARSLVSKRSHHLGLMVSDLHNPFFAEVATGVIEHAESQGYRVLLNTGFRSPAREAEALDALLELRMDGILMAGARTDSSVIRRVAKTVPVAAITRSVRLPGVDVVVNDDRRGAHSAVDHLVELGHRDIAHIDGGGGSGAKQRARGYREAMQAHGLEGRLRVLRGDYTEEAGARGIEALLEDPSSMPSAIFCANDYQAVGALDALQSAGYRVPGDVSLVGYDNVHLAELKQIDLTTIDQPRVAMGQQAAQLVLERIDRQRAPARRVVVPPRLVVRGSTAPPSA